MATRLAPGADHPITVGCIAATDPQTIGGSVMPDHGPIRPWSQQGGAHIVRDPVVVGLVVLLLLVLAVIALDWWMSVQNTDLPVL